jgi:hypothetical protein
VVNLKLEYILGIAALSTLLLNVLLTVHLMNSKGHGEAKVRNKAEIVHFTLVPAAKRDDFNETEVLETEIISEGNN